MKYTDLLGVLDAVISEIEHGHGSNMDLHEWEALELRRDRLSLTLERLEGARKQDAARRVA